MTTSKDFWTMSDDEIRNAAETVLLNRALSTAPLTSFLAVIYDRELEYLAQLWLKSDCDKTLMKIKYASEIQTMSNLRAQWVSPSEIRIKI